MLEAKDYPLGTPIYSYVHVDGRNTHIDSNLLRLWCSTHRHELEVFNTPVDVKMALSFVTDNVISMEHVAKIVRMKHLDPIIYAKTGESNSEGRPNVMLVDGHHRYVLAAIGKMEFVPSYVLEPEQWQPFQIHGLPDLTESQLRARPVAKGGGK